MISLEGLNFLRLTVTYVSTLIVESSRIPINRQLSADTLDIKKQSDTILLTVSTFINLKDDLNYIFINCYYISILQ